MRIRIMEWNINQRSGGKKQDGYVPVIPEFVWEKMQDIQAHIIILTEFYKVEGWTEKIHTKFSDYKEFVTENLHNDVLILIKKDLLPQNDRGQLIETAYFPFSSYDNNCPDYLDVSMRIGEKSVRIIGSRIIVDTKKRYGTPLYNSELQNRHRQGRTIVKRIQELIGEGTLVIGAGDFNTGRAINSNENWSSMVLRKDLQEVGVKLYIPEGQSHLGYTSPDLFFASNEITVTNLPPYNWEYTETNSGVYDDGQYTKTIDPPFPDHGILIAEIEM